eukprot:TRINITY_DN2738_c0_g1_i1.p1 TRINITY_DN2738_c0_g1~~TRINITY_DN2738_c0_g1_i1.p1  ORF type:complete len:510 (+),score=130.41 TRINITY_DN2738_c0_g1_i1:68-1531(+)
MEGSPLEQLSSEPLQPSPAVRSADGSGAARQSRALRQSLCWDVGRTPSRHSLASGFSGGKKRRKPQLPGGFKVGDRVRDTSDGMSGLVIGSSSDPRNRHERVRVKQSDGEVWNILTRNLSSQEWEAAQQEVRKRHWHAVRRGAGALSATGKMGPPPLPPSPRPPVSPRPHLRPPRLLLPCPPLRSAPGSARSGASHSDRPSPRPPPDSAVAAVSALPPERAAEVASIVQWLGTEHAGLRGGFQVSGVLRPAPPTHWRPSAVGQPQPRCGAPPPPPRRKSAHAHHRPGPPQRQRPPVTAAGQALLRRAPTPQRGAAAEVLCRLQVLLAAGRRMLLSEQAADRGGATAAEDTEPRVVVADPSALLRAALARSGAPEEAAVTALRQDRVCSPRRWRSEPPPPPSPKGDNCCLVQSPRADAAGGAVHVAHATARQRHRAPAKPAAADPPTPGSQEHAMDEARGTHGEEAQAEDNFNWLPFFAELPAASAAA